MHFEAFSRFRKVWMISIQKNKNKWNNFDKKKLWIAGELVNWCHEQDIPWCLVYVCKVFCLACAPSMVLLCTLMRKTLPRSILLQWCTVFQIYTHRVLKLFQFWLNINSLKYQTIKLILDFLTSLTLLKLL